MEHYKENIYPKNYREEFQKDSNFEFLPVPASEWVFRTPPGQNIPKPKLEESKIQPAVLCTSRKNKALYEINSNVNVDFSQCVKGMNVPCHNKFMKHVATFKQNECGDEGMDFLEPCYPSISEFSTQFRLSRLQKGKETRKETKPY